MAQSLQDRLKCYICDQYIVKNGTDIFTSATENTKTTISDLLEQFIGHSLTRASDKSLCCSDCLSRINDYDLACYTAHQVQKELTDLLSATDKKYSNNTLSGPPDEDDNIEDIEDDDLDEGREDAMSNSFEDVIEEDHAEYEEARRRVLKKEEENSGSDDIKVEPLDIETDEYELHFYSIADCVDKEDDTYDSGDDNADEFLYQVYSQPVQLLNQEGQSDSTPIDCTDPSFPRPAPNYCLQCERNFETKELLRDHRRTIHKKPPKIHSCNICGTTYKMRNALRVHMLMHTGASPFKCDICGKKFTQKGALKRHMPIHTGECRYQCEKCGKQFIHYSSFHMHNLAHDDIRKKKCEVCGLLLRSNSHLKRHLQVHTGAKPHKCPKCDKTFAQRYNMMTHLRSHQGLPRKRKHTCPVCERTFTKEVSLQEHIATGVCQAADPTNTDIVDLYQQLVPVPVE